MGKNENKFKVGDTVTVVSSINKNLNGLTGKIINIRKSPLFALDNNTIIYGVEFNSQIKNGHNASWEQSMASLVDGCEYGQFSRCYNFTFEQLEKVSTYKYAYCKFKDNNLPYVFLNDIAGLNVGDIVVVDTRYGYSIATVSSLTNDNDTKATKMIVCKVDTKAFEKKRDAYIKKVEDERARENKKKSLIDEMKEVFASNCEMAQFKKMAKKSPEMAKLIKIYEDVENGKWKPEDDLPF